MIDYEDLDNKLVSFIQNELKKTGLKSIVLGLSGGLDSAIVAVLSKKAVGDNVYAYMLPNLTSNKSNLIDAKALCEKFDINHEIIFIDDIVDGYFKNQNTTLLRKGNFIARVRMAILYDISSKLEGIVIGTSNKSELALGYGTLYGDLACAINPIGEIYKSDLFDFAKYLDLNHEIISKPPSADLWKDQSDEKELGFSYVQIDSVLKDFLDKGIQKQELLEKGHEENLVDMVLERYHKNQFKRRLPIIAKL